MSKWLLASLVLVAVLALAFAVAPAPKAPARPAVRGGHGDIVLITIDTLRADAPGFAGNRRSQTPVLDRLAGQGRVFTNTHAHNVVTLPSHTNILTGLYPFQHGVRDNSGFRLPAAVPTLATVLHGAGYATGAFVAAFPLDSQFGLNRGFDVYDDHYPKGSHEDEFLMAERRGDEVVRLALAWWQRQKGKPRFLWVHLYDPHAPYAPPEPFASRFKDNLYLGEVAAADSFLAPLLGPFMDGKAKPALVPALVVVTADHGESLGEHGEQSHGLFAYEATLKVPLVVWGPGITPGRDARPARHVDILPTILQAAGIDSPAPRGLRRPGRSLLAPPAADASDSYFESLSATLNRGWAPLRGLLRNGTKFISLPLPEVYALPKDPGERTNLIDQERPAARGVFAALPKESAWPPRRDATRPEDDARLLSLGYIVGTAASKESYGPEDDPKRLIGIDAKVHEVIDLYMRGRMDESVRLARELVAARPSMALGQSLLAQSLLQAGKTQEALDVMLNARKLGAISDTLLCQLGLTLSEVGRAKEAIEVLRPLIPRGEPQSLNAYALALSEAGRQKEAFDTLQRLLKGQPDDPKAWEQLGLVELRLGHWALARDRSRHALELNSKLPLAWNNLGVAQYQLGQKGEALDAWQKAVDLKPDLWDALWNLGTKAAEQGKIGQARKALAQFAAGAPPVRYGPDIEKAKAFLRQVK
ncbi:MAG TPA: sulfatase-like hydrolase/transferase [Thermoanaerobaculia bacterium]|jgi:arylsulfatase A-like enzyme/Flp pilus assembly protein TadD|nr:sulfatase-like hydrolase/transferase [Thermoanaerobaculia bacterium]